jgi:hypothetical protein
MEMILMDTDKIFDYATTIILALIPVVLLYQDQILAQVPAAYKLIAIILLAGLSQYAANRRNAPVEPVIEVEPEQIA